MVNNVKKEELERFEFMLSKAKAKAYSKISLERELTKRELEDYKKAVKNLSKMVK